MTQMLVAIHTAREAELAIVHGVDRLVLRSTDPAEAAGIGAAAAGRCPVGLWAEVTQETLEPLRTACRADEIYGAPSVLTRAGVAARTFAVLRAADLPAFLGRDASARDGFVGVVLMAGNSGARLLADTPPDLLARSIAALRARDMAVVVAGPMEPPDVPRLLALAPDALLFDDVARQDGRDGAPLDADRLRLLRDLLHGGRAEPGVRDASGPDRILVRDWTVAMPIGAYSHEGMQRVSFTVEADLKPNSRRPADLRDVVSYDLITDAIARLTTVHVALVETLAEDLAGAVLAHPRVTAVDVTVEKLDLGPGRVGCRIRRRHPDTATPGGG